METLIVLTIVSLRVAILYAGRRAWLTMRAAKKPKPGCEDCGH